MHSLLMYIHVKTGHTCIDLIICSLLFHRDRFMFMCIMML